jgi:hypothetical protein
MRHIRVGKGVKKVDNDSREGKRFQQERERKEERRKEGGKKRAFSER